MGSDEEVLAEAQQLALMVGELIAHGRRAARDLRRLQWERDRTALHDGIAKVIRDLEASPAVAAQARVSAPPKR